MKHRKKGHTTTKNTQPKKKSRRNIGNIVGIICEMEYEAGFPTMKGIELNLEKFKENFLEQRSSPCSPEEIDEAIQIMTDYHRYSLGIDDKFIMALTLFLITRELTAQALKNSTDSSLGFLVSMHHQTGQIETKSMNYDFWLLHKHLMEKNCNKKFTYLSN